VAGEAERSNHDTRTAVPADYDKMAQLDPEDSLWVVKNRDAAHDVLQALNDPPDDEHRVEKEYSRNSPPKMWTIDVGGSRRCSRCRIFAIHVSTDPGHGPINARGRWRKSSVSERFKVSCRIHREYLTRSGDKLKLLIDHWAYRFTVYRRWICEIGEPTNW